MSRLCRVEDAIWTCTTVPRSLGEVLARVLKRLGGTDPTRARIGLIAMVNGKIGRDRRERFPRRMRRRRGQQGQMR